MSIGFLASLVTNQTRSGRGLFPGAGNRVAFAIREVFNGPKASAIGQESTDVGHKARAGTRSVMAALLACGLAGADAAQAQLVPADMFQGAVEQTPNRTFFTFNDAFTSAGEPLAPGSAIACQGPGYTFQIDRTFWFKVIGTGGPIALSTVLSRDPVDPAIAVYQANTQPADGTVLDCNDDAVPNFSPAALRFNSAKGATYYTQWGTCVNSTTQTPCPGTPGEIAHTVLTNDQPAFATGGGGDGTNVGATTDAGERTDCKGVPFGATVWFSYTAPARGTVSFDLRHRGYHALAVYRGTTYADCSVEAGGSVFAAQVTVPNAASGEHFLVQVGGVVTPGGGAAEDQFTYNATFTENRDLDGDGFPKPPGPDCDDANPGINPGARDVPGNRIDEDCKDGDAPYPRLLSTVEVGAKRGRLTLLRAKRVPAGATIRLRCNRRCVRRAVVRVSKAGTVSLLRTLRKRRLAKGTALTVTITLPGHVGTVSTIRVNKNRRLSKSDACLPPGVLRPVRC